MIMFVMQCRQMLQKWLWVNVKMVHVGPYRRKGKLWNRTGYNRAKRPKGKKRIVDKSVVMKSQTHDLERVRDEYGRMIGWK